VARPARALERTCGGLRGRSGTAAPGPLREWAGSADVRLTEWAKRLAAEVERRAYTQEKNRTAVRGAVRGPRRGGRGTEYGAAERREAKPPTAFHGKHPSESPCQTQCHN